MATLDEFLRQTIETVKKKFPDAGILLVSVEDLDDEAQPEITYLTNMGPEEMAEVVSCIVEPDDGTGSDERLDANERPEGMSLH
jgi:hypothetical protein